MFHNTRTGLDLLMHEEFVRLRNKRIGLITNHTGLAYSGISGIDILHQAADLELKCLFSPEHGVRGELDEKVLDGRDTHTGLPVYSLYGERNHPTAAQLQGLDLLIYDIQDIGCRFYTYISTLGLCLETAAKFKIPFMVLDRPNPINGITVEGPLADSDKLSFTSFHTIPIRHGMTAGELAMMFNAERKIHADLEIVKLDGWFRSTYWDSTGLTWINPSPNMRSMTQALLYPGIGLLETTNVSVGRGCDTPFEIIGAPFIDERTLSLHLNEMNLPGVRFIPIKFKPKSSTHAGEVCGGVNILIDRRDRFIPVLTGLSIAEALFHIYPDKWEIEAFGRLLVHANTFKRLKNGNPARSIVSSFGEEISEFQKRSKPYLLY